MKAGRNAITANKGIGGALGAIALIGWGLYGYSAVSAGSQEDAIHAELAQLRRQLEQVSAERSQLAAERNQLVQSAGDLQQLQRQIASDREQLKTLEQARAQLMETIAQVRSQLAALTNPSTGNEAVSEAGSNRPLSGQKAQVSAIQEALTKLGVAELKADGVLGPNTRQAIEAFERSNGLPVTGKLDTRTIQAIGAAAGVSIQ
ncbi:MAG TPA: peptidoglycan-binding protein [Microvirga sp.]|nr:peptidoglycan-binding protein [Microvirga sp.]